MKKVLFVLAFVAVYAFSMAMTSTTQVISTDQTATISATVDNNIVTPEGEKEKKTTKAEAKADAKAKTDGCTGDKAKSSSCSGEKTKCKETCSGEKSAKKADCGSSCGGTK